MSDQTLTFTSSELFLIQEMMREAKANPFHPGDYQDDETEELIERIVNALNKSYDDQREKCGGVNEGGENLKPCPFCGGTDVHVIDKTTFSFIECYDCLAAFHQLEACSVDDNVEAWNKRPETKEEAQ